MAMEDEQQTTRPLGCFSSRLSCWNCEKAMYLRWLYKCRQYVTRKRRLRRYIILASVACLLVLVLAWTSSYDSLSMNHFAASKYVPRNDFAGQMITKPMYVSQLESLIEARNSFVQSSDAIAIRTHKPIAESTPEWLKDYILLNRNRSVPYIRYVCPRSGNCGGVGDRISGILQAFYMGVCTNRRILIEWYSPAPLQDYLTPNCIDWIATQEEASREATLVDLIDQANSKYMVNPSLLPDGNIDLLINVWLEESFMRETYTCLRHVDISSSLYRTAFWTLFQWSPAVERATQLFRQSSLSNKNYLALHVRTGRGASFHDPFTESSEEKAWQVYLKCAQKMQRLYSQRFVSTNATREPSTLLPIFVTADTNEVKLALQKLDTSVVTTSSDAEIYHIDRTVPSRLHHPKAALLQVWVDLKLLVDCTCIVMSTGTKHGLPSKFSRMAMWLPPQPRCAVLWHDCEVNGVVEAAIENIGSHA
ncbi:hypothetical protein MPSEU_000675400 [Mayamaea pseudoterrestris]|nr:hypothetical protein MPSEU_000675400 [Mayamaea pseudoterrestris]